MYTGLLHRVVSAYIDMQHISRAYRVIKDFIRVSWQDYYVIILR